MAKEKPKKKTPLSDKEFSAIWTESRTVAEMAARIGDCTRYACSCRASKLRRKGVSLKKFTPGQRRVFHQIGEDDISWYFIIEAGQVASPHKRAPQTVRSLCPPLKIRLSLEDVGLVNEGPRSWGVNAWGYVASKHKKGCDYLHRVINKTPKGMLTDHINGDRLDNRRENLRTVNNRTNSENVKREHHSKCPVRNVHFAHNGGGFTVIVTRKRIGTFLTSREAHEAAVAARAQRTPGAVEERHVYPDELFDRLDQELASRREKLALRRRVDGEARLAAQEHASEREAATLIRRPENYFYYFRRQFEKADLPLDIFPAPFLRRSRRVFRYPADPDALNSLAEKAEEMWNTYLTEKEEARKNRTCTEPDCERKVHAKGLCRKHYMDQWIAARDADVTIPRCHVEGCERAAHCKGLCGPHYGQEHEKTRPPRRGR